MGNELGGNASVKCPTCGGDSTVSETRRTSYGTRRRRKCDSAKCSNFTTVEIAVPWDDYYAAKGIAIVRQEDVAALVDIADRIAGKPWRKSESTSPPSPAPTDNSEVDDDVVIPAGIAPA